MTNEFIEEVSKMVEKGKEENENKDDKFMADICLKKNWIIVPLKTSKRIDSNKGVLTQTKKSWRGRMRWRCLLMLTTSGMRRREVVS